MSLTIEQQKNLYNHLYELIIELHNGELRDELRKATEEPRNKNNKGIILLDYHSIKEMIQAVKNKAFFYEWIPKEDALKIKHAGIPNCISRMNPQKDCILVCSMSISLKHLYVNCVKIKDIDQPLVNI